MEIIAFAVGVAVGAGIAVVVSLLKGRQTPATDAASQLAAMQQQLAACQQELSASQQRCSAAEGLVPEVRAQLARAGAELETSRRALDAERQERVKAQTTLTQSLEGFAQQKAAFEQARNQLLESFKALSSDALRSNNQSFLDLAKKAFEATLAEARGDIGQRQEAIDGLIKPLSTTLHRYEEQIKALEQSRQAAYGGLQEQIKSLTASQLLLQKEASNLVTALRAPQVRGRWGEVTLHRVVELAGMCEHCDYAEQVSVDAPDGRLRPDMVVHLPNERDIVVDSKVSLEAYLRATAATDEVQRRDCLLQHAAQIRTHMQRLSEKSYWAQFDKAPEFVVMFIPGESFFAAALDMDTSLLEDGMEKRVVLATPTTLIALLRAVAFGWRQEQMAANARLISDLGRDLYDRLKVLSSHIVTLGTSLKRATDSYNKTVGSMETRVMPSARKFQELGIGGEAFGDLEQLEIIPRTLTSETADE